MQGLLEVGQGWLGFIIAARAIIEANFVLRGGCYLRQGMMWERYFYAPFSYSDVKFWTDINTSWRGYP